MTDVPLIVRQLREPITDTTRKIRRELLICSTVGIVIVHAGLVPTRIDALGIELTPSNQAFFRYVIAGVVLYLTATFLIYVTSEIIAWGTLFKALELDEFFEQVEAAREDVESARKNLEAARKRVEAASAASEKADSAGPIDQAALLRQLSEARVLHEAVGDLESLRDRRLWLVRVLTSRNVLLLSKPMRTLRICFEAVVPLVVAAFSVWSLFCVS
ncbi:MAG: hypothetical protein ACFFCO_12955 [Promethearchaeota archaeon]